MDCSEYTVSPTLQLQELKRAFLTAYKTHRLFFFFFIFAIGTSQRSPKSKKFCEYAQKKLIKKISCRYHKTVCSDWSTYWIDGQNNPPKIYLGNYFFYFQDKIDKINQLEQAKVYVSCLQWIEQLNEELKIEIDNPYGLEVYQRLCALAVQLSTSQCKHLYDFVYKVRHDVWERDRTKNNIE